MAQAEQTVWRTSVVGDADLNRSFLNNMSSEPTEPRYISKIGTTLVDALDLIEANALKGTKGGGIYVGLGGIAFMYLHMFRAVRLSQRAADGVLEAEKIALGLKMEMNRLLKCTPEQLFEKARHFSLKALEANQSCRETTMLEGQAGLLVLSCVISFILGEYRAAHEALEMLTGLSFQAANAPAEECEVLYGRAGYINALQHLRALLSDLKHVSARQKPATAHKKPEHTLSAPLLPTGASASPFRKPSVGATASPAGLGAVTARTPSGSGAATSSSGQASSPFYSIADSKFELGTVLTDSITDVDAREVLHGVFDREGCVQETINRHIHHLFEYGAARSKKLKSECPLEYSWHEKTYYGAAHGLAGILFTITTEALDPTSGYELPPQEWQLLRDSTLFLCSKTLKSGNLPSSKDSTGDKLVQWCHGAPGFVYPLTAVLLLHKSNPVRYPLGTGPQGRSNYTVLVKALHEAAANTWDRGLLKKGPGLCHGIPGNGYALLRVYKGLHALGETDEALLGRAQKFALFLTENHQWKPLCGAADRPQSLYEGLAAVPCFLLDLIEPLNAKMPAFEP